MNFQNIEVYRNEHIVNVKIFSAVNQTCKQ